MPDHPTHARTRACSARVRSRCSYCVAQCAADACARAQMSIVRMSYQSAPHRSIAGTRSACAHLTEPVVDRERLATCSAPRASSSASAWTRWPERRTTLSTLYPKWALPINFLLESREGPLSDRASTRESKQKSGLAVIHASFAWRYLAAGGFEWLRSMSGFACEPETVVDPI